MELKPGIQSTEFLTSLGPIVLGIILVLLGVFKGQQNLVDAGIQCTLGGSGIYGISRGLTKLGHGIGGGGAAETPAPANDAAAAAVVAKLP